MSPAARGDQTLAGALLRDACMNACVVPPVLAAATLWAPAAFADHTCEEIGYYDEHCTGITKETREQHYAVMFPIMALSAIGGIVSGVALGADRDHLALGIPAVITGSVATMAGLVSLFTVGAYKGGDEKADIVSGVTLAVGVPTVVLGAIAIALRDDGEGRESSWHDAVQPTVQVMPDAVTMGFSTRF